VCKQKRLELSFEVMRQQESFQTTLKKIWSSCDTDDNLGGLLLSATLYANNGRLTREPGYVGVPVTRQSLSVCVHVSLSSSQVLHPCNS